MLIEKICERSEMKKMSNSVNQLISLRRSIDSTTQNNDKNNNVGKTQTQQQQSSQQPQQLSLNQIEQFLISRDSNASSNENDVESDQDMEENVEKTKENSTTKTTKKWKKSEKWVPNLPIGLCPAYSSSSSTLFSDLELHFPSSEKDSIKLENKKEQSSLTSSFAEDELKQDNHEEMEDELRFHKRQKQSNQQQEQEQLISNSNQMNIDSNEIETSSIKLLLPLTDLLKY